MEASKPQTTPTESEASKAESPAKVKRSGFVGAWSSGRGDLSRRVKDDTRRHNTA